MDTFGPLEWGVWPCNTKRPQVPVTITPLSAPSLGNVPLQPFLLSLFTSNSGNFRTPLREEESDPATQHWLCVFVHLLSAPSLGMATLQENSTP
jgi:hypothetical protein